MKTDLTEYVNRDNKTYV